MLGELAQVPHIPKQEPHLAQGAKKHKSTHHATTCEHFDLYKQHHFNSRSAKLDILKDLHVTAKHEKLY